MNIFVIFLKIGTASTLCGFVLISMIFVGRVLLRLKNLNEDRVVWIMSNQMFTFSRILNSKYCGLFMFLVSNVLTGLVNITLNIGFVEEKTSLVIISLYMMASTFLTFSFYLLTNKYDLL